MHLSRGSPDQQAISAATLQTSSRGVQQSVLQRLELPGASKAHARAVTHESTSWSGICCSIHLKLRHLSAEGPRVQEAEPCQSLLQRVGTGLAAAAALLTVSTAVPQARAPALGSSNHDIRPSAELLAGRSLCQKLMLG